MYKDIIRSTFWDSLLLIAGKLCLIAFSFIAISLTTRVLGVEGYGKLALFLAVIQLFFLFGVSWTQSSLVRYGIEEYTKSGKINKTIWTRVLLFWPLIFICLSLLYLFRNNFISYTGISTLSFNLMISFFTIYIISSETQCYLRALNKIKLYGFLQSIEKVIVVLGLSLIMLQLFPKNINSVISVYIAGPFVVAVPILTYILFKNVFPIQIDRALLGRMFIFSFPLIFRTANTYIFNWIDIIIIKKFMSIKDVGIYSLAYNGMSVFQQFSMMTTVITIPLLVTFLTRNRIDLIKRYISRIIPQALFFWVILLSLSIMAAPFLIPILGGERFNQAIIPFSGLLIGLIASGFSSLYTPVFQAYEMTKQVTFIAFVSTPLKILGDFILIPKIGIIGAVTATALSFFMGGFLRSLVIHRKLGLKIDHKMFIFFIPAFIALYYFNIRPSIANFAWGAIIFVLSLLIIMVKFKLFSKDDIRILQHIDMPVFLKKGMERFYIAIDAFKF